MDGKQKQDAVLMDTLLNHTRIKAQVRRMREAVERVEAFTALHTDGKAVSDELVFLEQTIHGLKALLPR
jgi:hypothetical protein